jgi:DNA-directed RNA polymerase subunit beta'
LKEKLLDFIPWFVLAFNADLMEIKWLFHVPLSEEAQAEAKQRMLSSVNLLKPSTGDPIMIPTKDMVLGCYYLTKSYSSSKRRR